MNRRWIIALGALLMPTACLITSANEDGALQRKGKFHNSEMTYSADFGNILAITKAYVTARREEPTPQQALPVRQIPADELQSGGAPQLYRLGHSTILIRLDGEYVLTDPVFSDRASPVQWAGPKRFHQAPVNIAELPSIKVVVLSHDHYDHLDKASIIALKDKVEHFVAPLKVGKHLREWGVEADKISELDWWQEIRVGSLTLTATPAQHFSGRGLLDRDKTLWASWVIEGEQAKLFFGGDSGYFGGFKEIGERFGPFDVTMIENGAYNDLWQEIHMLPEQSLQAHLDLKGKAMLPIHNSTFDLSLHDWHEPLERIHTLAQQNQVQLLTPVIGEPVSLVEPAATGAWWREMAPAIDVMLASE